MSRHSTSFKAEAEVPAEAVQELLPQPNPVAQSAAPAASQPSYKNRIRRLLTGRRCGRLTCRIRLVRLGLLDRRTLPGLDR